MNLVDPMEPRGTEVEGGGILKWYGTFNPYSLKKRQRTDMAKKKIPQNSEEEKERLVERIEAGDDEAAITYLALYGSEKYRMTRDELDEFFRMCHKPPKKPQNRKLGLC